MPEDKPIIFKSCRELPPMTASMGRMSVIDTGSWRNAEPFFINHTPPCTLKCPAGNDIVGFLRLTSEGKFTEAWELIRETSPFPGVCGRVCPHPCESECNREQLGGAVNIHSVERFLADMNADTEIPLADIKYPDKRVAIIGSGPAGLSCAWHLNRAGYPATVFEKYSQAGGMMRVGIPDYRLPKGVLDREIAAIQALGTEIKTGVRVGTDIAFYELLRDYAAVFIAVGNHKSRSLGAEGENHPEVVSGVEILRRVAAGEDPGLREKALVVGGGNTAMDAARSAHRLGSEVRVIYRRTRAEMPAITEEIDECLAEGIPIEFLSAPVKVHSEDGKITRAECIRMKLGEPDASGRRRPIPVEGSNFFIETDQIITAIGETPDLSFVSGELKIENWGVPADDYGQTNIPGVFAGGDASTGEGTVAHAIGSGHRAAIAIRKYLEGGKPEEQDKLPQALQKADHRVVRYEDLNTDYFDPKIRIEADSVPVHKRRDNFLEINQGMELAYTILEAQRCMSCGTCVSCDNCYVFCPDAAIHYNRETGVGYLIDLKHCKGCGLCAAECPRLCIELKPVR